MYFVMSPTAVLKQLELFQMPSLTNTCELPPVPVPVVDPMGQVVVVPQSGVSRNSSVVKLVMVIERTTFSSGLLTGTKRKLPEFPDF